MENKMFDNSRDAKIEYTNRVMPMMEAYYGDIVFDLEGIDKLQPNEILFFLIRPKGTHKATPENYDVVRDEVAKVFGNYIVIKVFRDEDDFYHVKNWDKLITKSFDTSNVDLIQRYKDFDTKI